MRIEIAPEIQFNLVKTFHNAVKSPARLLDRTPICSNEQPADLRWWLEGIQDRDPCRLEIRDIPCCHNQAVFERCRSDGKIEPLVADSLR